jgi:hypothetical protein
MADDSPQESKPRNWLTLGALGTAAGIALYVFTIGNEIGTMRQQTAAHELRLNALEEHGSGPVQTNAAKVEALNDRVNRILTEGLLMQQRIADQGAIIARLQQDIAARRPPPPTKDTP